MHRVLVALLLTGAAIYTTNTVLLGDKRVLFGESGSASDARVVANQTAASPPPQEPLTSKPEGQSQQGAHQPGPDKKPLQNREEKSREIPPNPVASKPWREKVKPVKTPKMGKSRKAPVKQTVGKSGSQAQQKFQGDRRLPRWGPDNFSPPEEGFWRLPPSGRRGQRQFADEYIPPQPGRRFWRDAPPWQSDW